MKKSNKIHLEPKRFIAAGCVVLFGAIVLCIGIQNKNITKYEHKSYEYDVDVIKNDEITDTYEMDESAKEDIAFYENTYLSDENIYSSIDAVNWNDIPINTYVYCRDDDGNILRYRNVPPMNETKLYSMLNYIDNQDELSIVKGVKIRVNNESTTLLRESYEFDKKTKSVINDNGDDVSSFISFDTNDCHSNLEFLTSYLNSEGMPSTFSIKDNPLRTYFADVYEFSDADTIVDKKIKELSDEYEIDDISYSSIHYELTQHEFDEDAKLSFITVEITGYNSNDDTISLYVTYSFLLC